MRASSVLASTICLLVSTNVVGQEWYEIPDPFEKPVCMSRDGSGIVYGEYYPEDGGSAVVGRWSRESGLEIVDPLGFGGLANAVACSEDGSTVMAQAIRGYSYRNFVAGRNGSAFWLAPSGYSTEGHGLSRNGRTVAGASPESGIYVAYTPCYWVNGDRRDIVYPITTGELDSGYATGISTNGDVIVGQVLIAHEEGYEIVGFRYVVSENRLQKLRKAGTDLYPSGCSRNGKVTFGFSYRDGNQVAVTWNDEGVYKSLGKVRQRISQATLASCTGNVIAGWAGDGLQNDPWRLRRCFVWTAKRGSVDIGDLGADRVEAQAMTKNGKFIVGNALDGDGEEIGFIWSRETGIHPLIDVLRLTLDRKLKGYKVRGVYDISLDGRQMSLYVAKPNKSRGAVFVTLPAKLKFPRGRSAYVEGDVDASAALACAEESLEVADGSPSAISAYLHSESAWAASAAADFVQGDESENGVEDSLLRSYCRERLRCAAAEAVRSFIEEPTASSFETWYYATYASVEAGL